MANVHKMNEPLMVPSIQGLTGTPKDPSQLLAADLSGASEGDVVLVGSNGTLTSGAPGASPTDEAEVGAGLSNTTVEESAVAMQRLRIEFTGEALTLDDTTNLYTGVVATFGANRRALVFATAYDLTIVKSDQALSTTDLDIGFGTTEADGQPLVTTEDELLRLDLNDDSLTIDADGVASSVFSGTTVTEFPLLVSTDDVWLNIYGNISGGDGTLTITGTVDFYFMDIAAAAV